MEADARTLLTVVGPLAIMYMTYSSITATAVAGKPSDLKPVSIGQVGGAPKLPSADGKLRNPFVPRSGSGGGDPLAQAEKQNDPEKKDQPLRLDGTAIVGNARFAIINGVRVPEGDYFRGMRLTKIEATQVTLTGESEQVVLPLEIARSDSVHAPAAATIVAGSHPPPRTPTASPARDEPSRPTSSSTDRSATRAAPGATAKREPSRSSGAPGSSLLIIPGGASKSSATNSATGAASRR